MVCQRSALSVAPRHTGERVLPNNLSPRRAPGSRPGTTTCPCPEACRAGSAPPQARLSPDRSGSAAGSRRPRPLLGLAGVLLGPQLPSSGQPRPTWLHRAQQARCQMQRCLMGSAAPSRSWKFCSMMSRAPSADSRSRSWKTAGSGASWTDLRASPAGRHLLPHLRQPPRGGCSGIRSHTRTRVRYMHRLMYGPRCNARRMPTTLTRFRARVALLIPVTVSQGRQLHAAAAA